VWLTFLLLFLCSIAVNLHAQHKMSSIIPLDPIQNVLSHNQRIQNVSLNDQRIHVNNEGINRNFFHHHHHHNYNYNYENSINLKLIARFIYAKRVQKIAEKKYDDKLKLLIEYKTQEASVYLYLYE
jgi:hypothetical protein